MSKKNQYTVTRLTLRFDEKDIELLEAIKKDYNVRSTIAALRLALRLAQLERFPAPYPQMEKK
jgi:hypothetical protein